MLIDVEYMNFLPITQLSQKISYFWTVNRIFLNLIKDSLFADLTSESSPWLSIERGETESVPLGPPRLLGWFLPPPSPAGFEFSSTLSDPGTRMPIGWLGGLPEEGGDPGDPVGDGNIWLRGDWVQFDMGKKTLSSFEGCSRDTKSVSFHSGALFQIYTPL